MTRYYKLESKTLDPLPIINRFLDQLRVDGFFDRFVSHSGRLRRRWCRPANERGGPGCQGVSAPSRENSLRSSPSATLDRAGAPWRLATRAGKDPSRPLAKTGRQEGLAAVKPTGNEGRRPGVASTTAHLTDASRNVSVARQPLFDLSDWANRFNESLAGRPFDDVHLLNNDRVGRCLEYSFMAERETLFTDILDQPRTAEGYRGFESHLHSRRRLRSAIAVPRSSFQGARRGRQSRDSEQSACNRRNAGLHTSPAKVV